MDWIALASVVSSAAVAIVSTVVAAASKRGDRKHAAALDYEQRIWEAKSAALIDVIGAAYRIDSWIGVVERADTTEQDSVRLHLFTEIHERARAFSGRSGAALVAYGSKSVREALSSLSDMIESDLRNISSPLYQFRLQRDRKEKAIDEQDWDTVAAARDDEKAAAAEIAGAAPNLDLRVLRARCRKVIETARADLRGPI